MDEWHRIAASRIAGLASELAARITVQSQREQRSSGGVVGTPYFGTREEGDLAELLADLEAERFGVDWPPQQKDGHMVKAYLKLVFRNDDGKKAGGSTSMYIGEFDRAGQTAIERDVMGLVKGWGDASEAKHATKPAGKK